ncbi:hypothetical protein VB618_14130 [Microvirga sp. CF3062]|uniref:hypothetical protein n=1 Tax=Microvirga sp. CF3062 TaxID=3110182 RepID=UPI002E766DFB|nr:hypothetical protein [Microvirga sp. CF3062]MEE1657344.1 hypothetical protein [Microvirga sp. CF3062]
MAYLYWLGGFVVVSPLIVGLPFLSRNRGYRIATLFAGMNAGIVTLSLFINLLRWGSGPTYVDQLHGYFTRALPSLYIASLLVGSTIVSKYYLRTTTRVGASLVTLGTLFSVYAFSTAMARLLEILSITVTEGFPSFDVLSDIMDRFLEVLIHPNLSFVIMLCVSVFIALNGTAAAMRISDEAASLKDGETD